MNNDPDKGYDEHIDNMILEKQIKEHKEMTKVKELSYKAVWDTLRKVDTSKVEYSKMGLTYIGWADAFATLMDYFPQSTYIFEEPTFYGETGSQTCEVTCSVYIGNLERSMSLPVMSSGMPMKSIVNPTSTDINDAQQRCLVKCIAMFGLGLHLWERKTYDESKTDLGSDEMPF